MAGADKALSPPPPLASAADSEAFCADEEKASHVSVHSGLPLPVDLHSVNLRTDSRSICINLLQWRSCPAPRSVDKKPRIAPYEREVPSARPFVFGGIQRSKDAVSLTRDLHHKKLAQRQNTFPPTRKNGE